MPNENEHENEHENENEQRDDERERQAEHGETPTTLEAALEQLEAERGRHAETRREAATRRRHERELEQQLEQQRQAGLDEHERELESARSETRTQVEREAAERITRSEVRAAAGGRLRDPADALAHVDLGELAGLDDDEREAAITRELDRLLEAKPYLARNGDDDGGSSRGVLSQGPRSRRRGSEGDREPEADRWLRKRAGRR